MGLRKEQTYEEKLAKIKASQEKSRAKKLAKINSTKYKDEQRKKAEKAQDKLVAKINSTEYKEKQIAKAVAAQKRQQDKKKEKPTNIVSFKQKKPIRSKGLKGIPVKSDEKELHDKMASLGCICCINLGLIQPFSNSPVSIHHIDGRTKKGSHKKTLPLCGAHHDCPLDEPMASQYKNIFPIHAKGSVGGRAPWEKVNGTQYELLDQVMRWIYPNTDINKLPAV
jgi:hypothetical protein